MVRFSTSKCPPLDLNSRPIKIVRVRITDAGPSVALSSEGNTAILGGPLDNSDTGGAWVFFQRAKDDCKDGGG
jgi:hypothetical protein